MTTRNDNQQFAGFWIRFLALAIDGAITTIPFAIIGMTVFGASDFRDIDSLLISYAILITLYMIIFPVTSFQATPGKAILGLKLIDREGGRISIAQSIGRFFSQFLSQAFFFIGYLMVGFNRQKTGLHDILAGTYVVKKQRYN
ncbi:RDD family protein [Evansella tamaricis]|uniref:RDD family protein n=1 Tax=Evansella tamaricis TaxID=2069301 RepID=A0ABS6J960_9BACI|nr:RDD family protein [Evansella tamaricis]MBU9710226.1 RDD family protein [Evansella tamaricis]